MFNHASWVWPTSISNKITEKRKRCILELFNPTSSYLSGPKTLGITIYTIYFFQKLQLWKSTKFTENFPYILYSMKKEKKEIKKKKRNETRKKKTHVTKVIYGMNQNWFRKPRSHFKKVHDQGIFNNFQFKCGSVSESQFLKIEINFINWYDYFIDIIWSSQTVT